MQEVVGELSTRAEIHSHAEGAHSVLVISVFVLLLCVRWDKTNHCPLRFFWDIPKALLHEVSLSALPSTQSIRALTMQLFLIGTDRSVACWGRR